MLREMFSDHGAHNTELKHVDCMSAAEKHLGEHAVDIILLDPGLPDAQGLGAIRRAHAAAPRLPLVVLTNLDDESVAEQALQEGAQDYLIKGQIEVRGILRALRYATERKRLERLKDEFVSTVSHELRTPLTSISGSLGLLIGNAAGNLPNRWRACLRSRTPTANAWCGWSTTFLISRRFRPDYDLQFQSRRSSAIGRRRRSKPIGDSPKVMACGFGSRRRIAPRDVQADPDRLFQVVTNLLSNAIKFSPKDSEVVVAVEKGTDMVRLTVRDHGPGIPVDFKPLIFEKFAQADAGDARQKGGTGLGLSIVKEIVDRLSGEVGFADAPGGGTVFHVQLPCWDHVANLAIDREAKPNAARLLLCEDDLDTAVTLREQLRQVGFATDFAYSAGEAIDSRGGNSISRYSGRYPTAGWRRREPDRALARPAAVSRHADRRRIRPIPAAGATTYGRPSSMCWTGWTSRWTSTAWRGCSRSPSATRRTDVRKSCTSTKINRRGARARRNWRRRYGQFDRGGAASARRPATSTWRCLTWRSLRRRPGSVPGAARQQGQVDSRDRVFRRRRELGVRCAGAVRAEPSRIHQSIAW